MQYGKNATFYAKVLHFLSNCNIDCVKNYFSTFYIFFQVIYSILSKIIIILFLQKPHPYHLAQYRDIVL